MQIRIPQLKPYWYQMGFCNAVSRDVNNILITWPRRHGKDVSMLSGCIMRAMQRVGNYYYLFPTRAWAERALWNNVVTIGEKSGRLIDILIPPEIVQQKNVKDVRITLKNGSVINFGGTDNLDFVGQGGYLYVLSEFSLHKPEVTDFIAPILTQGNALLWMNGTLRGKANKLYELMENNRGKPDWFVQHLDPSFTKQYAWVSPEDGININPELIGKINPNDGEPYKNIQDMVDSGIISFAYAMQEYMNRAVSTSGTEYYGREMKHLHGAGKIKPKLYDDRMPVFTFWDLGGANENNDFTAIGFVQKQNDELRWIDYYQKQGGQIKDHLAVLRGKPYKYAGHYMPHDARRTNTQTGQNLPEYIRTEHGLEIRTIPKTQETGRDIEFTRREMRHWWFDSVAAKDLVICAENYASNPKTGKPIHDEYSHGADVLRYGAMAKRLGLIEEYLTEEASWRREQINHVLEDDWVIV